ncbi:hypothetical protein RF11_06968 [Thelohanellus kitauei]|uniref:Uncharacterized protein n=1 Tax=Thelohanellus kitauei TaxID=669202 RepID=A0A0C2I9K9_THEKT|nr:hypothetical protein RF11_06968 [Thelohanellus kitauei]
MAIYSIKKRHPPGLLIGVVLSTLSRIDCVHLRRIKENHFTEEENARTYKLSTQQIVALNVIDINQSTGSALPALPSMARPGQRTRKDANTYLPSPNSLSSIDLPIEYTLNQRGEQLLQYDTGPDEHRMLIF